MKHFFINRSVLWALLSFLAVMPAIAQTDTTATEEEDYSEYDNMTFTDGDAKRYCSPKILDLSPQRFVSVAWDAQFAYTMKTSELGSYAKGDDVPTAEERNVAYTGGVRIGANIPVVSRNNIVWQVGANFWDVRYSSTVKQSNANNWNLGQRLEERGIRTFSLNTTVFKPLNEKSFLLFQLQADYSGDYTFSELQPLSYLRYSGVALWGRRPHDRLQWGLGVSRTYRVGEMNYVPVLMYNWTAPSRKWGTEILLPARANVRYTISPRSLFGAELEGASYFIHGPRPAGVNSLELRRGEARLKLEYQRQLAGFVWFSVQAGFRHNWAFNVDATESADFFRGLGGSQRYAALNNLTGAPFINIGVHLVSP